MLRSTKIRTKLSVMVVVPVALVALLAGVSYVLVQNLSVNGPAYNRIATSQDFVADVSPPPLYLLEVAALVQELARFEGLSNARAGIRGEIAQAQQRYYDSYDEWDKRLKDPKARESLVASRKAANVYFQVLTKDLYKAQDVNDNEKVTELLDGKMDIAFLQHTSAIETAVGQAKANVTAEETNAATQKRQQLLLVGTAMGILIMLSGLLGFTTVRSINKRVRELREVATEELPRIIDDVKRATMAGEPIPQFDPVQLSGSDELTDAAVAFNAVLLTAVDLASEQARQRQSTSEMFVDLGRRNHKLLSRTLSYITDLERGERDPATLQNLFKLDHLATRMRRHAESLLVLAGSAPLRTWTRPVPVGDVLRAALSEIEAYDRVDLDPDLPVAVKGAAVSDVAHLLAEVLENAATFSPPQTRVRVMGRSSSEGFTLIVADEGIGMTAQELALANHHIETADNSKLIGSRMLGLGVVGRLAARHGLTVTLGESPMGGVVCKVSLPAEVLATLDAKAARSAPAKPVDLTPPDEPQGDKFDESFSSAGASAEPDPLFADRATANGSAGERATTATLAPAANAAPAVPLQPRKRAAEPEPIVAVAPVAAVTEAAATPAATPGGLRRRVRGAQLPETGPAEPVAPAPERTAESVRNALTSFTAGRRSAHKDS